MFNSCFIIRAAVAATNSGGTSSSSSRSNNNNNRGITNSSLEQNNNNNNTNTISKVHYEAFLKFLTTNNANFDGVEIRPTLEQSRGLFANKTFRAGTTVLSIPMHTFAITAEKLLNNNNNNNNFIQSLNPPTIHDIQQLMAARSIKDPMLCEQLYLSLLLACERINEDSFYTPYFDILPYPAIDDTKVIQLHKDVLDPIHFVEWDDHQREWFTLIQTIINRWENKNKNNYNYNYNKIPPIEVCYWAWRIVLSRMHLLPDKGLAPAEKGSKLNYFALSTFKRAEAQTKILKRIQSVLMRTLQGNNNAVEEYRLIPTLVPLLDMTNHLPSGNISVEVQPRPHVGSCVELQAVREINIGEEIGLCFNRSQGPAFTLYRFGFLPL